MQSYERVREIVHDVTGIPVELIGPDSNAIQLNLDSLDVTEVVMSIEEEFDILVENEDAIKSIADLAQYIDVNAA